MRRRALVTLLALGALAPGCAKNAKGGAGDVEVTLKDFSIRLSRSELPAGQHTFSATNDGPSVHEFEIFSVPDGVDPNALSVSSNVADTSKLDLIDEVEDIAPSTGASLTVTLEPRSYAVICNLPGHYGAGMHATFTVTLRS